MVRPREVNEKYVQKGNGKRTVGRQKTWEQVRIYVERQGMDRSDKAGKDEDSSHTWPSLDGMG